MDEERGLDKEEGVRDPVTSHGGRCDTTKLRKEKEYGVYVS